ncbi:hypothetical protein LVJ83_07450 [Uruburuella testudinis]|uniref:Uncharacterized protein n=1 Tax=Uruburuella testudinis TaxID=1282863 RepID=A0ABY4DVW0_9NEIS|nr:hypothetical protein [Uruburuella testudinis]UOO80826.1 hypothetical protein LVJ83_07450 [Uruburuella testudinis]
MSNERPIPDLTFTLEETAESQKEPQAQEEFDWERGLEQLREKRQTPLHAEAAHTDVHIAAPDFSTPTRQPQASEPAVARKPDAALREKILREYLQQWQQAHNEPFENDNAQAEEADASVLLQEDWLNAQTSLQTADDEHIQHTRTVWLNAKRAQTQPEAATTAQEEGAAAGEDLFAEAEQIPVSVQVIDPQVNPRLPVMCLSEKELIERLTQRLRPHLTDAVTGMVRVAVQKQAAALTYQLQQSLNEQTPALVDEILEYNLKAVMSEIRYSLKFKRR